MSTHKPETREELKAWCLRDLGFPTIEINVDDDQVEDRIDEALQYWQDYHYDALQKVYYIKALDNTDITNKYINMSPDVTRDDANNSCDIVGVTRVFPISSSYNSMNMFDLRYQLRLNELYDFTSASYVNYTLTQQHLRSLEIMFTGETPIRFQRHMHKLFIDWSWENTVNAGDIVIAECYATIDGASYAAVWNDRWVKEYASALIKRQWGTNLKKFAGVQLPGGVILNGDKIYQEADEAIKALREQMTNDYMLPDEWFMN